MSGGSFEYLCFKQTEDLFGWCGELQQMSDALAVYEGAEDVAAETQKLLMDIRIYKNRVEVAKEKLGPVWKAMEWWKSGDWGEEDFIKALEKFRGESE